MALCALFGHPLQSLAQRGVWDLFLELSTALATDCGGNFHAGATPVPRSINAFLVVTAWLLLTRALHFDGFLDIFDGLFGGFTPERRLEIMKDSRVGAFGAIAIAMALLTKLALVAQLASMGVGVLVPAPASVRRA